MRPLRDAVRIVLTGATLVCCATAESEAQGRFTIINEPDGSAVGVAIMLGAGTAWELRTESGLGYLAARSVVEEVRPMIADLGGRLDAECGRAGTIMTLALPASSWEAGARILLEAVFERPPSPASIERARRAIIGELHLAEGSDAEGVRTALARAEHGPSDRWARPPCGTTETIAALSPSAVRRLVQTRFTRHRAAAAIVGPVGDARPRALLSRHLPDSDLPLLLPSPTGGRNGNGDLVIEVERSSITAWTGLSYEYGGDADLEAVRLLGFMIEEQASPAPSRPEIYDATVELGEHGGGGTLAIYLVTAPSQGRDWIERVRSLIADAAAHELSDPNFEALRHRYIGRRLLELETPEARARDAVIQLYFGKGYRPPLTRIEALDPAALRQAASSLSPAAAVLLGPR